jgi:hypothetical protein
MEISSNSIASGSKLLSGLRKKKYRENHVDDAKRITIILRKVYEDVVWIEAAQDSCCKFIAFIFTIPATL